MRVAFVAALMAFAAAVAVARADAPPLRHLVYSFTYEQRQEGAVTNDPGTSGNRSYTGNLDDKGTMTVDVLREAADRGLVVVVSEQGEYTRRAEPATCAVYGNTTVACDPTKAMNAEELTLLRFLGANFYDPDAVDAKQRWSISQSRGGTTVAAQYQVVSNDGGVMKIAETRHVESTAHGSITVDTQTKIDYDFSRLLPTAIDEYTTEDQHSGVLGVSTTTYQTTLNLVSDSMSKGAAP
jgi:hypothetical protein